MDSSVYYGDLDLGDELPTLEREVSERQVIEFLNAARIETDRENRFTSSAIARSEGLPEAIVPGAMNIAIMSTLITRWSPSVTILKLDVVFRGLVLHNRPIKITGVITDKEVVNGSPQIECDLVMENDEAIPLVIGKATVRFPN